MSGAVHGILGQRMRTFIRVLVSVLGSSGAGVLAQPAAAPPKEEIDCGNSATTMRLLAGLLAGQSFDSRLVGGESLSKRPMDRVVVAAAGAGCRFAAALAEFGMLLHHSDLKQKSNFDQVISIAKAARGKDDDGYRSEFVRLAESAKSLSRNEQLITKE